MVQDFISVSRAKERRANGCPLPFQLWARDYRVGGLIGQLWCTKHFTATVDCRNCFHISIKICKRWQTCSFTDTCAQVLRPEHQHLSQVHFLMDWIAHITELQTHGAWVFQYASSIFTRAATLRFDPFKVLNRQRQHTWVQVHLLYSKMLLIYCRTKKCKIPVFCSWLW